MFNQALVHVACVVLAKGGAHKREFATLVTGNEPAATGDALRELRKTHGTLPSRSLGDKQWMLSAAPASVLKDKSPWRILTPEQRGVISALEAAQTPTVGSLFDIAQGVQTGNLKVFLFSVEEFRRLGLPAREKKYFREALMTDSIEDGRIVKTYHLFFPHDRNGPKFEDEAALAAAVPVYYQTILKPNEQALKARASIVSAKRQDWWGLMRPRTGSFAFDDSPRIVSKFFGAEGSFVLDEEARYLPSTGHVWTPKRAATSISEELDDSWAEDVSAAAMLEILRAYVALLNSLPFTRLVSFRSVTIAGGQYDLSSRFLAPVYLPNLWEKVEDPIYAEHVRTLARVSRFAGKGQTLSGVEVDRLVANLYGVPSLGKS
jgi:hypothetical protein